MRPTWGFVAPLLCAAKLATAVASVGHVYLYDPDRATHSIPSPQAVSPETARLIFAQRLALSQYHSLSGPNEEVLQQINDFGGRPQQLFGHDGDVEQRWLVVVEGVDRPEDVLQAKNDLLSFTIQSPPPTAATTRLVADLTAQADNIDKQHPMFIAAVPRLWPEAVDEALPQYTLSSKNGRILLHVKSLADIAKKQGVSSGVYFDAVDAVRVVLDNFLKTAARDRASLTIALMPTIKDTSKRSANPYGAYTLPSSKARRATPEEPLTVDRPSLHHSSDSTPHALANSNSSSAPLRGILPSCFPSLSACQSATRNCTGHGSCTLAHKSKDEKTKACYSCLCNIPDVRTNPDGTKKTTRYGGPACQKKDVVVPFWLLAGLTVGIVFVVSWAIGLLYGMGEEELPSVIGAGVSGVRPK